MKNYDLPWISLYQPIDLLIWPEICNIEFGKLASCIYQFGLKNTMRIDPISSHNLHPRDLHNSIRQGNKDFQRLANALDTGDLAGAQKALEAFKQDIQNIHHIKKNQLSAHPPDRKRSDDEVDASIGNGIGTHIDVIV